ncbi:MAG: family 10 glycosylhydrolase [Oscillospiraceae bacterium]|nr:family 10 glycosylhydrolase [Oscillospiraceae bacterium]
MKKSNNSLKAIMAIIVIFLIFSIVLGVLMTTRQTNAPAIDESMGDAVSSAEQNISDSSSADSDSISDKNSSESGDNSSQTEPAAEPTAEPTETAKPAETSSPVPTATAEPTPQPTAAPTKTPAPQPTQPPQIATSNDQLRAMWISYLEFQSVDFSSKSAFTNQINQMFANCADMGLNTVIVQVRPFGDALYNSSVYPTSHLINGTQGTALSFDPLAEMVNIAHSKGLRIEAWVNPYRVKLSSRMPANLAASNPANDTSLVFNVDGGIYYNPCLSQVQDMVVKGIEEIVRNYDVDGIHLDDYFYPSTDMSLDADFYGASGSSLSQADWRRENVNTLVRKIYSSIKSIDSTVTFGISPQGNNDNNYNVQYSDVNLWLREAGYVDYIMPQLYWGFGYLKQSGRDTYRFVNLSNQWASYPRHSSVKLHIGLGAYRIGAGDGGANDQSEWSTGYNLMKQINALNANSGISGFALYRYDNLFKNSEYASLAQSEVAHIKDILIG